MNDNDTVSFTWKPRRTRIHDHETQSSYSNGIESLPTCTSSLPIFSKVFQPFLHVSCSLQSTNPQHSYPPQQRLTIGISTLAADGGKE